MFKILMRKLSKSAKILNQKGFTLIETLIAVTITAIIVTGIVTGILTVTKVNVNLHKQQIAKDIAASAMDYIMSRPYANTYNLPATPANYTNYTSIMNVTQIDTTEQKLVIGVSFNNNVVYTLTDLRTNY
jgi:prepilin-type N-terminal cleavage/methylation domain-containing protein